jgi:hypothetical protein
MGQGAILLPVPRDEWSPGTRKPVRPTRAPFLLLPGNLNLHPRWRSSSAANDVSGGAAPRSSPPTADEQSTREAARPNRAAFCLAAIYFLMSLRQPRPYPLAMWGAILFYSVIGAPAGFMVAIALMEFARQRATQLSAPKAIPVRPT